MISVADMIKGEKVRQDVQEGFRIIRHLAQENYEWAQVAHGETPS